MRVTLLKSDKLTPLLAGGDAGVCEGVGSGVLAAGGVLAGGLHVAGGGGEGLRKSLSRRRKLCWQLAKSSLPRRFRSF